MECNICTDTYSVNSGMMCRLCAYRWCNDCEKKLEESGRTRMCSQCRNENTANFIQIGVSAKPKTKKHKKYKKDKDRGHPALGKCRGYYIGIECLDHPEFKYHNKIYCIDHIRDKLKMSRHDLVEEILENGAEWI